MNCLKQGKTYLDQEQGPRPGHCLGQIPTGKPPGRPNAQPMCGVWAGLHSTGEETEFPCLTCCHRVEIQSSRLHIHPTRYNRGDQIQPVACFCSAHELRLVFTFFNGWGNFLKNNTISWHVQIIGNSNFSVHK